MGIGLVLNQCISSAGDTLPPMLVTLLNIWLLQVPHGILPTMDYWSRNVWSAMGDSSWHGYGGNCLHRIFLAGEMEAEEGVVTASLCLLLRLIESPLTW